MRWCRSLPPVLALVVAAVVSLTCSTESTGPGPRITTLTFTPALDTLTALGATVNVTVHAWIGAQGYAGGSYTWTLTDTTVAKLYQLRPGSVQTVQALKNGTTFLRVREAQGAVDSARIVVRQRVAFILAPQSTSAFRGCAVRITVLALDTLNNPVPGVVLAWRSTNATLARVDSSGLVTPLAAGVDTIVVSAGGVTRRVALLIAVAPIPTFQASGAFAPVTTVGVGQYALGYGNLGTSYLGVTPARFRVVSSDTTILHPTPADTDAFLYSTTISAGPVRLVGRVVGDVMLTPYLCDAAGPSVPFRVTRARLKLSDPPPSTARTDDPPLSLTIRTQDSTGAFQFTAVPLTVRFTASDTNAIRADSAYRHLPVGTDQVYMNFTFPDTGTTRIVLIDSSGVFLPDSSSAVRVRYPPLYIFSYGASVGDTLHIGLRQKPFYDVYRAHVGLDRFVSGAPLAIQVSISDSTIARIGPDSLNIPVGQSATTGGFDVAARDTRGIAIVRAHASRHADDQLAIVVGRPALQVRGPSPDAALYPGDPGEVQVFATDSATGSVGFPTDNVTVALTVSDTAVISLDSATVTVPRGDYLSTLSGITFKKPGTVTITASDPRVAPYSYAPGTSTPFTILAPYLVIDSAFSLGIGQTFGYGVYVNGRLGQGNVVHLEHRNPAVATLADTIMTGSGVVSTTALAAGVDTVIATASGFRPDTGTIVVGPGTIGLDYWPPTDLAAGQTWSPPISLLVFAPNGEVRVTASATDFTITANANIEFIKDGAPVTTVTVLAGQHGSEQVYLRAKAAGTGTVTFSGPNYTPLMKSVNITP